MQTGNRLRLASLFLPLLVASCANVPAGSKSLTVHARVRDEQTGAPQPSLKVKVGYWHCVAFIACAIKPLAEGVSDPDGIATLVVGKRKSLFVRVESCPGEVTMLGVPIPDDDLKKDEASVDITAHVGSCRPGRP
jgi:hypothetical protein